MCCTRVVMWSRRAEFSDPYLIGVLQEKIEIRSIETRMLVQNIDLAGGRLCCELAYADAESLSRCL